MRFRTSRGVILFFLVAEAGLCWGVPRPQPGLRIPDVTANPSAPLSGLNSEGTIAGTFTSFKMNLLDRVIPQDFSTNSTCTFSASNVCANDVWAYVSPSGREYAILGLYRGTGFVDVTDPRNAVVVGAINDNASVWSDMKTYLHYCYNCNESGGGIQIMDMSNIDPPLRQVSLVGSLTASGLQTSHTLALNEASGFLYLCGSNFAGSGLVAVSLANPRSPLIVGQALAGVYVHSAQVVTYTQGIYAGREIAFCFCGSNGMRIVDVTNKGAMFQMGSLIYPNTAYCHQGWLMDDRKHILIDDELDETNLAAVSTTTTYIVNVENLNAPSFVRSFTNGSNSVDHNQMVRGNFTFQANYTSGLRAYDMSNLNATPEVGWLDTYPFNNAQNFNGAWGVYSLLPSGVILVSDMHHGVFMVDPTEATGGSLCPVLDAPQAEVTAIAKQRYLSFRPGNGLRQTGLRLKMVDLPPPFDVLNGQTRWLEAPENVVDGFGGPVLKRSRVGCEPVFRDWGDVETLHIADEVIVPGGIYEIQVIAPVCDAGLESAFSGPLVVSTPPSWGDVVDTNGVDGPDGVTNIVDVAVQVDKFKETPGALSLPRVDLVPGAPDGLVNISEVAAAVDGFKDLSYPYPVPSPCP